jgi:hypothetical protein
VSRRGRGSGPARDHKTVRNYLGRAEAAGMAPGGARRLCPTLPLWCPYEVEPPLGVHMTADYERFCEEITLTSVAETVA